MARFISHKCPRLCEENTLDSMEIVGLEGGMHILRCAYCGAECDKKAMPAFTRSNRYPQFNGCLGQVVESRDHENHVAKQNNMIPIDHVRVNSMRKTPKPKH